MDNNIEEAEENQNYNYGYQTSGEQDIQFQQAMPMENNEYNFNEVDEKLPPIYTQQIASIKETNETQIKYLEPIELSNDIDVNKFLSSGKLMKQIEPEILRIKQEAQKEGMSNDPYVHTEINFDLKQNTAIFEGGEGNNDNNKEDDDLDIKKSKNDDNGEIKYSSVLPPKFEKMKIINIDQYGNKNEEEDNDNIDNFGDQEQNNYISQQQINLRKEQLREQEEQQLLLKQQLEQEKLELQQKIEQEKIKQQQILQQQQKIRDEQIKQQQFIQQQRAQFQQPNLIENNIHTVRNQNNYPFMRANSDQISMNTFSHNLFNQMPSNVKTMKINDQYKNNNLPINSVKKDPIVQKAIKIYGTLRERTPKTQSILSGNEFMAAKIIQNKWRNHFIRNRFNQIKPQLLLEGQSFLKEQYEICDKAGPVASDGDFNPEGWKRFYSFQDAFFNFQKGFVIPFGVKIRHPYDPQRVSVYEGDVNINNQRHGFGRLTTVKSVYLGQWRNGEFTGWGRETRRSGKVYEGKYINGLLQGKGILKNNKGVSYVGDFKDSKRHGKGILDTHKVHYEGDFRDDKLCGKGRIIFKIEGHVYEGQFDNNEINGFGTFKWKNGDSYTGNMLNGKMDGKGKYRYNNGVVYEGIYKNGVKQGKGKVYNTNGMTSSQVQKKINQNNNSNKINISGVSNISKFS